MNIEEIKSQISQSYSNPIEQEGYARVSFSQYSMFANCPRSWELHYARKMGEYKPTIHTAFGTAFHETLQNFLSLYLEDKRQEALSLNLHEYLKQRMYEVYIEEVKNNSNEHFSTPEELSSFYMDGCTILNFVIANILKYFSPERYSLLGVEVPLFLQAKQSHEKVNMLSFLDLVLYDKIDDRIKIIDIKTSTKGWGKWALEDETKVSQVYIYKYFFSKRYDIPLEKVDLEFFIVLRQPEFRAERVQIFTPHTDNEKIFSSIENFNNFLDYCFNSDGSYKLNQRYYALSGNQGKNCRFCQFSERYDLCPKQNRLTPNKYSKITN